MTVLQVPDGLVVLNAVRLTDAAQAELDRMGQVKHLVKLSDSHSIDEPFYQDRYKPEVWALPDAKLEGITASRTLGPEGPVAGGEVVHYPGTHGWREVGYWVPLGGGTLVTCDAIQNHADTEGASFLGRVMTSLMGFKGGVIVPAMWRRFQKLSNAQLRTALAGLAALKCANLVTGHGPPVAGGADALVRAAIERASV